MDLTVICGFFQLSEQTRLKGFWNWDPTYTEKQIKILMLSTHFKITFSLKFSVKFPTLPPVMGSSFCS